MKEGFPVTVGALRDQRGQFSTAEAVSLALGVCDLVRPGSNGSGVSAPIALTTVFLDASGVLTISGGVPHEDDQTVRLIGRFLEDLLPRETAASESANLLEVRRLANRAGRGEVRASVQRLRQALVRFAPPDPRAVRASLHPLKGQGPRSSAPPEVPTIAGGADLFGCPLEDGGESRARSARGWLQRAAIVGMTLLMLAGAGAAYFKTGTAAMLHPTSARRSMVADPSPAASPSGWELASPDEPAQAGPVPAEDRVPRP